MKTELRVSKIRLEELLWPGRDARIVNASNAGDEVVFVIEGKDVPQAEKVKVQMVLSRDVWFEVIE